MDARPDRPLCYSCIHRREVPGSAHSACHHPATEKTHRSQFTHLAGLAGKRGGMELLAMASYFNEGPDSAMRELHIEAAALGIARGWFVWPASFDPVWLSRCDGYTRGPCGKERGDGTTCALSLGHEGEHRSLNAEAAPELDTFANLDLSSADVDNPQEG